MKPIAWSRDIRLKSMTGSKTVSNPKPGDDIQALGIFRAISGCALFM
jgi:hypothetical protein